MEALFGARTVRMAPTKNSTALAKTTYQPHPAPQLIVRVIPKPVLVDEPQKPENWIPELERSWFTAPGNVAITYTEATSATANARTPNTNATRRKVGFLSAIAPGTT